MSKPLIALGCAAMLACLALPGCESEHSPTCGVGETTGNADVPPSFAVDMGRNSGSFEFYYETRNAKDRVQVMYDGNELYDSGCVGETRNLLLTYGPGRSSKIDVVITPNCGGTPMTSWLFKVGCPAQGPRATAKQKPPPHPPNPK